MNKGSKQIKKKTNYWRQNNRLQIEIDLLNKKRLSLMMIFFPLIILLLINVICLYYLNINHKVINNSENNQEKIAELDNLKKANQDKIEVYNKWKEENERIKSLS